MKSTNFALILSRMGFKGYTTRTGYYQITGHDTIGDFNPNDMITIRQARIDLETMCETLRISAATRIIKLPASASASDPDDKIIIALWVNLS